MELRDLKTLLAVLDTGSFEAASRKLNITAAAVAHRIGSLEDDVGQMLVVRVQPTRATKCGEIVARLGRSVEEIHQATLDELGLAASGRPIVVAVNFAALAAWFEHVVQAFNETEGRALRCVAADEQATLELMRSASVDVALSPIERAIPGCISKKIGILRYLPVVRPDLLNAALSGEIPNFRFAQIDTTTDYIMGQLGLTSFEDGWVPSVEGLFRLARQGCGWTVLPEGTVRESLSKGELCVLESNVWKDLPLYFHCFRKSSDRVEKLLAICKKTAKTMLRPMEQAL